eukprot:scaffold11736_cov159-Ochromonas_danica.AAC.19
MPKFDFMLAPGGRAFLCGAQGFPATAAPGRSAGLITIDALSCVNVQVIVIKWSYCTAPGVAVDGGAVVLYKWSTNAVAIVPFYHMLADRINTGGGGRGGQKGVHDNAANCWKKSLMASEDDEE